MTSPSPEVELDLTNPCSVHIVGIGGAGMSAIAIILLSMGHRVSGSDAQPSPGLDRLAGLGATVWVGHDAARLGPVDAVAVSTAISAADPEVLAATSRGIPVLRRAQILAAIAATRRVTAVSGTHGKTSTSAMLATILGHCQPGSSYLVGGDLADAALTSAGGGARWADGEWFALEADESDGTFVELGAEIAVVTNVDEDHLDYWGSIAAIEDAFGRFLAEASGPNVVCLDDERAGRLAHVHGALTYGTSAGADFQIIDVDPQPGAINFTLVHQGTPLGRVALPAAGLHNARNAAAAIVASLQMGVDFAAASTALSGYAGVARRFEHRGTAAGVTFVDDYAHNPAKVAAALSAAAGGGWQRVVAVFQPHRYTRTRDLVLAFGEALAGPDLLVITDIYAAGEAPIPGVSAKLLVDAVLNAHPRQRVAWLPRWDDVVSYLTGELRPGDVCLSLGAGTVTRLADHLLPRLAERSS